MEIISRKEAKEKGLARFYTGNPCKYGHIKERITSNGSCIVCHSSHSKKSRKNNPETKRNWEKNNKDKVAQYNRNSRLKNPDRVKEDNRKFRELNPTYHADWQRNNPELVKRKSDKWRSKNPLKIKERTRLYYTSNRQFCCAKAAKQRAERLKRTVSFSDPYLEDTNRSSIEHIFYQRDVMASLHGKIYHVDHIVPLQGDLVSGLHVWYNLQVMEGSQNIAKKNKFVPYSINHLTGEVIKNG